MMTGNPRLWSLMCLIALLACQRGHGSDAAVLQRVEAMVLTGAPFVDLTFFGNVKASSAENVSLHSLGDDADETLLGASPAGGLGGRPRMLRMFLSGNPPAGHAKLRVCLGEIEVDGTLFRNVCAEGRIVRDAAAELARIVQSMQSLPKVQGEKAVSVAGFFGQSGGIEVGAADINLVRGDFGSNDLNYFWRLKRGSLAGMDPRNMEAGATYSRGFLLHRKQRTELARQFTAPGGANRVPALMESLQRNWFAGHIVEAGVKLESDAAGERQWLGLVDAGWSLQSTTRQVKLPGAPGWFRFRWLAGGVEAGRNQARVKMGADAALLVRARGRTAPIRRLEFHAQTINRWLARSELGHRGIRLWLQADAKAFLFESERVRYGVRFTLQRGSLPPVYVPVNSVQFGFILESTEGDQ